MSEFREIQENLFDYFLEVSDEDIVKFIDCFIYNGINPKKHISQMIEKFLEDSGLVQAFINYQYDLKNPKSLFRRSSSSEIDVMNNIRNGLLSLAYNRFRIYLEDRDE